MSSWYFFSEDFQKWLILKSNSFELNSTGLLSAENLHVQVTCNHLLRMDGW